MQMDKHRAQVTAILLENITQIV